MTSTEYRVVPIEKEDGYEHPYQEFTNLEAAREFAYENEHIYCEIRKVTVETIETIRTPEPAEEPKQELTPAEIKKAWNTFKKELKKEYKNEEQLHTGFVMNGAQIAKRTATYAAIMDTPFDECIARNNKETAKIMSFETWSDESKQSRKEYYERINAWYESLKQEYGTPRAFAEHLLKMILESKSLEHFADKVGTTSLYIELSSDNCYRIRFTY